MGLNEEMLESLYIECKRKKLSKKQKERVYLYPSVISGYGFLFGEGEESSDPLEFEVPLEDVVSIEPVPEEKDAFQIKYEFLGMGNTKKTQYIRFYGVPNRDRWMRLISDTANARKEKVKVLQKEKEEWKRSNEEARIRREAEAEDFYNGCYNYHIGTDTPFFEVLHDGWMAALVYVGDGKSLHFLKIDGYNGEENHAVIPYEKIHYYEKAGDMHYVSDVNASYKSYSGGFTGGSFSKLAALGGGLLFGWLGMTAAALFTHRPAEQKPSESSFEITSDLKEIDDRTVILNFFSDIKGQYIDISLPKEIYNFLQTHYPEKKLKIVEDLESHKAVQEHQMQIEEKTPLLGTSETQDDSMEIFQKKVEKLKYMKEAGLLSDEEFAEQKAKLLESI